MYCSHCGAAAEGNFCARCGKPLRPSDALAPLAPLPEREPGRDLPASDDWSRDPSYRSLIGRAFVCDLIKDAAAASGKAGITGEDFMDKFLFKGAPLSTPIMQVALPIAERLGLKTGKSAARDFDLPIGRTIVAALCAMASRNVSLHAVSQAEDGCILDGTLPSDVWTMKGQMKVSVQANGSGSTMAVETRIPGQLFDWGKSNRIIASLFDDVLACASRQP